MTGPSTISPTNCVHQIGLPVGSAILRNSHDRNTMPFIFSKTFRQKNQAHHLKIALRNEALYRGARHGFDEGDAK
jgi:hypothetical protein